MTDLALLTVEVIKAKAWWSDIFAAILNTERASHAQVVANAPDGSYDPWGWTLGAHVVKGYMEPSVAAEERKRGTLWRPTDYQIYVCRLRLQAWVPAKVKDVLLSCVGMDYGGIFDFVSGGDAEDNFAKPTKPACSQVIAYACWKGGWYPPGNIMSWRTITPRDFFSWPWQHRFEIAPDDPEMVLREFGPTAGAAI